MSLKRFEPPKGFSPGHLQLASRESSPGEIQNPDGYGKRIGDCGDTVETFLSVRENRIQSIFFRIDGCMHTTACCNAVGRLVEGRKIEAAWAITPEKVAAFLELLPPDHLHCAELAVGSLYLALTNYQELHRSPWKRIYKGP